MTSPSRLLQASIALLLLAPLAAGAFAAPVPAGADLLVGLRGDDLPALPAGAKVAARYDTFGIVRIVGPDGGALERALAASPHVAFVTENGRTTPDASTWDASTWDASTWDASTWDASTWDASTWDASTWDASTWDASTWDASTWDGGTTMDAGYPEQWGLGAVRAHQSWSILTSAYSTKACVLDTGVDLDHPDLSGALAPGHNAMQPGAPAEDDHGHGTHVAGVLGAIRGNGIGVAGAAAVTVLPVKVMDASGGTEADLIAGLEHCVLQGARVAAMSLHVDAWDAALASAIDQAIASGVTIVASAGNSGGAVGYPAAYAPVIAVAAVGADGRVPTFSSRGPEVDLAAPGVKVGGTYLDGGYAMGTGTSQAVPFVAAAAAMLAAQHPDWTPQQIQDRLLASARDVEGAGRDDLSGHGVVDMAAAMSG